jgi:hypothetical protein
MGFMNLASCRHGVTRHQWLVLLLARLGWVFDSAYFYGGVTLRSGPFRPWSLCRAKYESSIPAPGITCPRNHHWIRIGLQTGLRRLYICKELA